VPAAILPGELQRCLSIICQYVENPIDLEGKNAADMFTRKTRRRRRARSPYAELEGDEPERNARKEKKRKEELKYKSAALIQDSDEEYGDWEKFFEKEAALRLKAAAASVEGLIGTMKATGTKKRRKARAESGDGIGSKKRKDGNMYTASRRRREANDADTGSDEGLTGGPDRPADSDGNSSTGEEVRPAPKSLPRPRPRFKGRASRSLTSSSPSTKGDDGITPSYNALDQSEGEEIRLAGPKKNGRILISDDEE
jgi:replication fork protection complex subunit Tof1/Swi1